MMRQPPPLRRPAWLVERADRERFLKLALMAAARGEESDTTIRRAQRLRAWVQVPKPGDE